MISRYILKQILITLCFALFALCIIFIVVNLIERIDSFMDAKVPLKIIIEYYLVYLPDILKILTPVSILISCLFVVGRLSNNNEIIAMKTGGVGLYRLIIPIAIVGLILSVGQYYFNGWVVPFANEKKENITYEWFDKGIKWSQIDNLAFRDATTRNVLMQYYNPKMQKGFNVVIEDYDKEGRQRLISKIEADFITWNDTTKEWTMQSVIERKLIDFQEIKTTRYDSLQVKLNINSRQIEKINRKPYEMNFTELEDYISLLKRGGKDTRMLEVEYSSAQALPLANFIVILFAVSFASVKKRGGLAIQIAAAMIIAFTYLIFFEVSKPIGIAMNLSTTLIGWLANILFFIAGIISIIKTRT